MNSPLTCFKAYDIRGRVPEELNETLCYCIAQAYAQLINPGTVVVGYDIRHESLGLSEALIRGLTSCGVHVIDIGLCGTEEVYFQTVHKEAGGGIMVTASHNPKGHNGLKMVREKSIPISADSGLMDIRDLAFDIFSKGEEPITAEVPVVKGSATKETDKSEYIDHLLGYINLHSLKPLKIVVNPGNGTAGPIIKLFEKYLPFKFIYLNEEPDGDFPNGIPNPLLPQNRPITAEWVKKHNADMGIAWDGDFDRCFFFDENGAFIEGYYLVGLLAESFLQKHPYEKIIHDARLVWNTIEMVKKLGGTPVQSKAGHAFMKERMRQEKAIYGGEMSAHHYFRDFSYCDSGMIPWLLIAELMSQTGSPLSLMVYKQVAAYPCSGELNYTVKDSRKTIERLKHHFSHLNPIIDATDGLSLEFSDWRFNIRASNTEPLLRLNVETRSDQNLLKECLVDINTVIQQDGD